ncbi:protein C19orf12 homolog [Astyanax mexicanus]|uniref:protein C19orf12 homolog n=1 Tax=Astyanax mexicanus TaxID=7994 RepID=UPI0020CB3284|nr:protein C19orf12 homolog [Astyanax mexicanus]
MDNQIDDIMDLCCELSKIKEMKAAVKNSGKGAVVAGGGAFVGGLLAGPVGIAAGGAVGGLLGMWMTSGQFKPVPEIIMKLSPQQQQKLYSDIMAILKTLNCTDVAQLVALVKGNADIQQQVIGAIQGYITKELRAEVQYGD